MGDIRAWHIDVGHDGQVVTLQAVADYFRAGGYTVTELRPAQEPRKPIRKQDEHAAIQAFVDRIAKDPAASEAFLKRAGILDDKGNLAPEYGGEGS